MARKQENAAFMCMGCGNYVYALTNGSYRNHCPFCLYSRHVDHKPGDRENTCFGMMKPVGLTFKKKKGWQIMHQCTKCKMLSVNKVAQDTVQADDINQLAML